MSEKVNLTIEFHSQDALLAFAHWLSNSGEQSYFEAMYDEDYEEDGVKKFHYHGVEDETKSCSDADRYGEFMCDNTIRTSKD